MSETAVFFILAGGFMAISGVFFVGWKALREDAKRSEINIKQKALRDLLMKSYVTPANYVTPVTWNFTLTSSTASITSNFPNDGCKREDLKSSSQTEPIIGYRVWRLLGNKNHCWYQPILQSVYRDDFWPPGHVIQAKFMDEEVPADKFWAFHATYLGNAGIYACLNKEDAKRQVVDSSLMNIYSPYVYGEVSMWGKVVRHERGYRSEFAYPKRLIVPREFAILGDIPAALRSNYGVEADWESE